jgi:hypothetical protein
LVHVTLGETLSLWHRLADATEPVWTEPEQLSGFLQALRYDEDRLELALLPLPHGEAVLARVREMFRVTASPPQTPSGDAYFVARHPTPLDEPLVLHVARSHLQAVQAIATNAGVAVLEQALVSPDVVIASGPAPASSDRHDTDSLIYDTVSDWIGTLEPDPPWIRELQEAFYGAACDYFIAWHLMWPWFARASDIGEPFASYFALWAHGIDLRFVDDVSVRVYVPTANQAAD